MLEIIKVKEIFGKIKDEIRKAIVGQNDVIDLILAALLCRGHVLLEGVPGTAKTLTIRCLAYCIKANFQRIQMTPDLMPSDIIGTNVFDQKTSSFYVHKGPIFSDIILVDEINRAPAKTQSALLESMEERQVTIEGNKFKLSPIFMVLATQNPLEFEGTYPLPEAQLDRFLFKILINYPSQVEENKILEKFESGFRSDRLEEIGIVQVAEPQDIIQSQELLTKVTTKPTIINYITQIVRTTREHPSIYLGAGVRASIGVLLASKAVALLEGRDYVIPDDVKKVVVPTLRHRIFLKPELELEGVTTDSVLSNILNQIKVPR